MKTPVADAFFPLRRALEEARVRYAVGGSWASTAYGEPRFTNGVDILADLTEGNLNEFLIRLPKTFYADADEALRAVRLGRPFNVIYMPMAFKFDFFPAGAFAIGRQELDRAIYLPDTGLSETPAPFVTPEDVILDKLHWFKEGGGISEVQWRDIRGIIRGCGGRLDRKYLEQGASHLGLVGLLEKALGEE